MISDTNSRVSRVLPVFGWLATNGSRDWATDLLGLAEGLRARLDPGKVLSVVLDPEVRVEPSAERLRWMVENVELLAPRDGRRWRELRDRVLSHPGREQALTNLRQGSTTGIPTKLRLETATHADCLVETERVVMWIEGKRNDWLDPSTTWDVTRDQLARNIEAAWLYATKRGKDCCVVICHETELRHHERALIDGYRDGTWQAGLPHVSEQERTAFADRIGTLTWSAIAHQWPELQKLPELADLAEP